MEILFEAGQINEVASQVATIAGDAPVLRLLSGYLLSGTFDPLDALSIALGSGSAYIVARTLRKG
jgi:hypothetical protein